MKVYFSFALLILLFLSACGTVEVSIEQPTPITKSPVHHAAPVVFTPTPPPSEGRALVAYTRDGNVFVWDEATGQSKTIFASGDVSRIAMSDDGHLIALVRHSEAGLVALWAVDWNGRNPRELVSAEIFRQRLETVQSGSDPVGAGIGELEWIPGAHRLIYNWTMQESSGDYWASPDLYLLDAEALSDVILARDVVLDSVKQLDVIPSPDGQQLALMTSTALSFLRVDGSNRRDSVLAYSPVGASSPPMLMSTGVWTGDSQSFLITGSLELDAGFNFGFSIWRVPVDGSASEALTPILKGHPDSVTFAPDGQQFAFRQNANESLIMSLAKDVGPLATTYKFEPDSYADLHWSPTGESFTKDLLQLCVGASLGSDLCGTPFDTHMSGVVGLQWLDGERVLFLTNSPCVLFLGRPNSPPVLIDFSESFDGVLVGTE